MGNMAQRRPLSHVCAGDFTRAQGRSILKQTPPMKLVIRHIDHNRKLHSESMRPAPEHFTLGRHLRFLARGWRSSCSCRLVNELHTAPHLPKPRMSYQGHGQLEGAFHGGLHDTCNLRRVWLQHLTANNERRKDVKIAARFEWLFS